MIGAYMQRIIYFFVFLSFFLPSSSFALWDCTLNAQCNVNGRTYTCSTYVPNSFKPEYAKMFYNSYYVAIVDALYNNNVCRYFQSCIAPQTLVNGVCVNPTCSDGIKNQAETGIDCGGPCSPCIPTHCTNTVQDGNETGINCGGSCPSACVEKCPSGYVSAGTYTNLQHVIIFGFFSAGDYSNDPEACVKMDPYDPSMSGPTDCNKTWLSYVVNGQEKIGCGDLRKTYPAADTAPALSPLEIEIVYPSSGGETPSPGGQLNPDTSTMPASTETQSADKCTDKVMSDGSTCTVCTSPGGGGSVSCVGPNGTLTQTKSTTQTPIVDGCNKITYGNGTTCDVCRDSVTGVQTVTCKDASQNTVAPETASPTAVGDGLLGAIDKKMGDVRGQLQGVGSGIDAVVSNTNKGNALQTEANKYLKTISEKSFSTTGIEAKINTTNQKLDTSNDRLNDIKTSSQSLHEKFTDATLAQVQTSSNTIGSEIDSGLDASGAALNSAAQGFVNNFDPSTFSPFANITDRLATLFPAPGVCTALVIDWTPTIQTVIPCEPFDRFKDIFAWLLYIWTSFYIIETLFGSRSSGSRKD